MCVLGCVSECGLGVCVLGSVCESVCVGSVSGCLSPDPSPADGQLGAWAAGVTGVWANQKCASANASLRSARGYMTEKSAEPSRLGLFFSLTE